MQTHYKLNNGNIVPIIGLGTWKSENNKVGNAIKFAITEAGYRHIDCASIYRNEKEIGEAFKDVIGNSVKRKELFVTSKLWNTEHRSKYVEKACKNTLKDLRLEYLDLYLMHWGVAFPHGEDLEPLDKNGKAIRDKISIQETWKAMEELVKKGLVKSIGVANFTTMMLVDLLTYASIKPVMNQIELHPYNTQTDLLNFCKAENITVTAYSPLGRQGVNRQGAVNSKELKLFDEPIIKKIAKEHKKSLAQILLNWGLKRGTIVIPKSVTTKRIKENMDIFDFELTDEEQNEISSLNKDYRFVDPREFWNMPYFI